MLRRNALLALGFFAFLSGEAAFAMLPTNSIPRTKTGTFLSEGLIQGGTAKPASIENLRVSEHRDEGYERWVFDFGPKKGARRNRIAPLFQIQYRNGERFRSPEGDMVESKCASFIFRFQNITQNRLTVERLKTLAEESDYVKQIVIYPSIEDGDIAIEFDLNHDVLFEAHQPIERDGRLVVDLVPHS